MNKSQNSIAGSNSNLEPAFILVGKFQRSHGVSGEISMQVHTDYPERIRRGRRLFVGHDHQELQVEQTRWKGHLLLLKLQGIDTPEDASKLTNQMVFVHIDDIPPLPEGEYYHHQLIGLDVYEDEERLGVLASIIQTGANDVYIVEEGDGKELLIPAIPSVVLSINLEQKRMQVKLMEGLRS